VDVLKRLGDITGYQLRATDGEVGTVKDLYFDDEHWTIRYLVVDTGNWLNSREVLISPMAVTGVSWNDEHINVSLSKAQVEQSPSVDLHKPVSRQYETRYYAHFGYAPYWTAAPPPGMYDEGLPPRTPGVEPETEVGGQPFDGQDVDSHLHSARDVTGYHILATDGEIGHVDDFIVDDESWVIRFIEVDTSNWIGGESVLVPRDALRSASWPDEKLSVALTRAQVEASPRADEADFSADYERRLDTHYRGRDVSM
jgi:sporulation protein YlmC with PRC-barrel domain